MTTDHHSETVARLVSDFSRLTQLGATHQAIVKSVGRERSTVLAALHRDHGLSYGAIASLVGCSRSLVQRLVERAR